MGNDAPRDITAGEIWRGQERLSGRIDAIAADVTAMRDQLASQSVKVTAMWAGIGAGLTASGALIASIATGK